MNSWVTYKILERVISFGYDVDNIYHFVVRDISDLEKELSSEAEVEGYLSQFENEHRSFLEYPFQIYQHSAYLVRKIEYLDSGDGCGLFSRVLSEGWQFADNFNILEIYKGNELEFIRVEDRAFNSVSYN